MLAAASLAALLLYPALPDAPANQPEEAPVTARLDAASDRPFAVFATRNPNIAIVWFFKEAE